MTTENRQDCHTGHKYTTHHVSKRAIIVAVALFTFIVIGMLTFVVIKKGEIAVYTSLL